MDLKLPKSTSHGSRKTGRIPDSRGRSGAPCCRAGGGPKICPDPRKGSSAGFDDIEPEKKCEPVAMDYNASVSDMFQNRYLSPAPRPSTTLHCPLGHRRMVPPTLTAEIDDSQTALRSSGGQLAAHISLGIPFLHAACGREHPLTSL